MIAFVAGKSSADWCTERSAEYKYAIVVDFFVVKCEFKSSFCVELEALFGGLALAIAVAAIGKDEDVGFQIFDEDFDVRQPRTNISCITVEENQGAA